MAAFVPTANQTADMQALHGISPGLHWFEAFPQLQLNYPNDFADNGYDVYVVANNYASLGP